MILIIDHYDSFTYNLVQYFGELGEEVVVKRNDELTIEEIKHMAPNYIVLSSGPQTALEAGISLQVIHEFSGEIPLLGISLSHQIIAKAFGAEIEKAKQPLLGKTSAVFHDDHTIYSGLKDPFLATRYHSFVIKKENVPTCLEVAAWTDAGEIMGIRHKEWAVEGVQFQPESITTEAGKQILKNFLQYYRRSGS
ncbi:aminodeoxychorismate/anthranilate synthase component II [Bacillus sp. FJAT-50079]|uniref:anthranilate synthase component II n=1 Tax=Bacillus sp. FJAT-50079 TaxID=2833577 RepID=UPI001BCA2E2F|nr:aminodeoxychorismate/anthranilate synthase component II [Bacillus sp. FJAT-50079]MBS4209243.1 aminodeoxychorismate/anthranilate synthase component II [Bacillus sp. FJAT-50079]